jgi:hypothetical protein
VKVALFDVRDAARPALLDSRRLGERGSLSALDFSAHGLALQAGSGRTRMALPMLLMPAGGSGLPQLSLQRFEVDTQARTLATRPPLALGSGWADLGATRALLLGEQLHLLHDGDLRTWDW